MSDTVWIAVVTAVAPTLAVILSNISQSKKTKNVEDKVDQVHQLANNRLTTALDKIEELTKVVATLRERGGKT